MCRTCTNMLLSNQINDAKTAAPAEFLHKCHFMKYGGLLVYLGFLAVS